MESIKERLNRVAYWLDDEQKMCGQLGYAGEAIESEFEALADRIEALESKEKITASIIPPDTLEKEEDRTGVGRTEQPGDLPAFDAFDKHNKPLGGLKRDRDMISYGIKYPGSPSDGRKCFGLFHHKEGAKIWGYWQDWQTWELNDHLAAMPQDRVTFEFRLPEKDC